MSFLGYTAAALIATGIVIPLGIDVAPASTNFVGYVAWCLWLIAMAVALWRTRRDAAKDTDHKGSIWSDAKPSRG